jgi:isoleucyl-tRNA synthetase
MPFTMEEIYQLIKDSSISSSQLLDYPKLTDVDQSQLEAYGQFKQLRQDILKALEQARQEGLIGSSQEATIIVPPLNSLLKPMEQLPKFELSRLLIVSSLNIQPEQNTIQVMRAQGEKCDRCWNYFPQLNAIETFHICDRCLKVIR